MRKGFLSIILLTAMAVAPSGASAKADFNVGNQTQEVQSVERPHHAMDKSGKDFEESWEGENTEWIREEPDAFTSDYGESEIARKMTQAEKNRNAAENDGWGGAITIIAMCIVISALVVLSILFMIFGKVSETLISARKKKAKAEADHPDEEAHHELAPGEVIAAISLALSEYFGGKHDEEDTILTIHRMKKAYSPWNSKIYNLRQVQDHRRNPATEINFHESKRIQI